MSAALAVLNVTDRLAPFSRWLAQRPICGYHAESPAATEPTALAALALAAYGHRSSAEQAAGWLEQQQASDGSLGVAADHPRPRWPTSLAVLAWNYLHRSVDQEIQESCAAQAACDVQPSCAAQQERATEATSGEQRNCVAQATAVRSAVRWILSCRSETHAQLPYLGHDTSLAAWPWVEGTHGWIEPTSLHVLALKAVGYASHRRTREAVRMLLDRQLSCGGCNYGNTVVLGQRLRPQVQSSGMALLALAGEPDPQRRLARSRAYLRRTLGPATTSCSLAWGLLGLAAHEPLQPEAQAWATAALKRATRRDRSPYKTALLLLAALGDRSPTVLCVPQPTAG